MADARASQPLAASRRLQLLTSMLFRYRATHCTGTQLIRTSVTGQNAYVTRRTEDTRASSEHLDKNLWQLKHKAIAVISVEITVFHGTPMKALRLPQKASAVVRPGLFGCPSAIDGPRMQGGPRGLGRGVALGREVPHLFAMQEMIHALPDVALPHLLPQQLRSESKSLQPLIAQCKDRHMALGIGREITAILHSMPKCTLSPCTLSPAIKWRSLWRHEVQRNRGSEICRETSTPRKVEAN